VEDNVSCYLFEPKVLLYQIIEYDQICSMNCVRIFQEKHVSLLYDTALLVNLDLLHIPNAAICLDIKITERNQP